LIRYGKNTVKTKVKYMRAISGNTYPVKEQIRALGARWNADKKGWDVADEKADQAKAIVAAAPAKAPANGQSSYRPSRCKTCGCAASQYNPIYRSGDCKDCWLSEKKEREMGY
jgi:hypothetical protein